MATHRSFTSLLAASGANGTLGSPSGSAAGDIDVIYYTLEDDQPIVPPPGYIILRNQDHASQTVDQWTMWKRLGGSTGGGTVTHASTWRSGACVGVQNASATVNPRAGANNQGTGTTATALSVTPVGNDAYIGYFVNTFNDMGLITPPSGTTPTFTERWDSTNNGYVADGTLATAGATGNKTNTFGGSQNWAALMVVVEDDGVTTDDPTVIQVQRGTITTSRSPAVTFDFAPLEDDIVVFFPSSIDTASITLPSGWNNILGGTTDVESDAHQLCGVYHVVTAAEASGSTVTFTATNLYDTTETGNVVGVVLRNVDTADPIDVTNTDSITGNSTTHVLPGLTPTESDGLYMACVAKDGTGIYQQLPAGYQWTVDNTNQGKVVAWLETLTTASTPISAQNITATGTDEYASIAVVWRKASTGLTISPVGPTVTVTPGTPSLARSITPTGPTVTVTPGTPTVALDQAVTPVGPSVSVTPGTPAFALSVTPLGPTVSVTPGSLAVAADQAVAPVGPTVTVTAGTPAIGLNITPAGPTVTVTPGTVDLDLAITPTGPTVSVTPGTLTVSAGITVSPVGPTVTVTPGTLGLDLAVSLTGPTVTVSPGVPSIDLAVSPVGPTVTVTAGEVTVVSGLAVAPIGPTVTVTAGSLVLALALSPVGPTVTVTPGTLTVGEFAEVGLILCEVNGPALSPFTVDGPALVGLDVNGPALARDVDGPQNLSLTVNGAGTTEEVLGGPGVPPLTPDGPGTVSVLVAGPETSRVLTGPGGVDCGD